MIVNEFNFFKKIFWSYLSYIYKVYNMIHRIHVLFFLIHGRNDMYLFIGVIQ